MILAQIVETLVTAAEEPLDSEGIAAAICQSVALRAADLTDGEVLPGHLAVFAGTSAESVESAIVELNAAYVAQGRALAVVRRPRGWQLMTRPEFADFLLALFPERRVQRLSGPALETLAIVAYRQPVTKAEIESVRGVSADGMLQKLLDLEMVKIGGRAELPGRPLQYVTTGKFLEHFNLRQVDELPNSQELRRIPLPTAAEAHAAKPGGNAAGSAADATLELPFDAPAGAETDGDADSKKIQDGETQAASAAVDAQDGRHEPQDDKTQEEAVEGDGEVNVP